MKKLHPLKMIGLFFVLGFMTFAQNVSAMTAKELGAKLTLPSSSWVWDKDYSGDDTIAGMFVQKTGKAVNLRVNHYAYPDSAKQYLDAVRDKLMEKPEYKGGEFKLVERKMLGGKAWDYFKLKRKDNILQEIWSRKGDNGDMLFVMYTTAGDDLFNQYHEDFMVLLSQLNAY